MTAAVARLPLDDEVPRRLADRLEEATRRLDAAKADAEDARGLSDDLQARLARLEADRARLLRAQGSRLLPWLAAGAAAGIAGATLVLVA